MAVKSKIPFNYWLIAMVAVIWQSTAAKTFIVRPGVIPAQFAVLPEAQQRIFDAMPSWLVITYGIAMFGGLLGSFALLLRRRFATPLFALSLIALVVHTLCVYLLTPAWDMGEGSGLPMTLLIVFIAMFLLSYSSNAGRYGWLR